jgi:hypothetical protein
MSSAVAETAIALAGASVWPRHPAVYEINTWIWLSEVGYKYGRDVDLSSVPSAEWDAIAAYGFDAVWFMGVWERSPAGMRIANRNLGLLEEFRRALPDFRSADNVGSPYCVRSYVVDRHLGGSDGLAIARRELLKRGMKLVLDFVPNHVAPDHPWVDGHPEYFIPRTADEISNDPTSYLEVRGTIYACGRDPYLQAWADVLQLNAFHPSVRGAVIETISSIAQQCDGIRCDMAMLLLNCIFERTWGGRAGQRPATEYWVDVISAIKNRYPRFLFIAEAYWDVEWELQQQGFDFCYDKKLYDGLEHSNAEAVRLHLCADLAYQNKLVRFIENHDEPRAAATFSSAKHRAIALIAATLPGMRLFHEGQLEGRRVRLPVFLARRPKESFDRDLQVFYTKLAEALDRSVFHEGQWTVCERTGWLDNASFQNVLAWSWLKDDERYLIIVNLSDYSVQSKITVPWADAGGETWHLTDILSGATFERDGDQMQSPGVHVELGPWHYHFFRCLRSGKRQG